jgi:O-antigen/teichoic acid export membrane protein
MAFGQYSAAFAYVGLFRLLPDFGMAYASTLEISRDRSRAAVLVGNLLGFQAVLSAVTLVACLGLGTVLFEGPTWTATLVLSVDLVLKAVKSTLRFLLKSHQLFAAEAVSLLIERAAILVLAVAALRAGYGLEGFVLVFVVVRLLDTTGLYLWVRARVVPLTLLRDTALWSELLWKGLPYAYAGAVILLFFQVDQVLIELLRGSQEVGWYGAPVRVLEGLTLVPRILGYALIPTMAALFTREPGRVTHLYARGTKYLLLAGLPVAAFGALASGPFIFFLFGPDYGPSAAASRILLPASAFMFLSNFGETTLACINRWRTIVVVSTVALAANVGLNLLWIPRYGFTGAAWATLLTEGAYFVMTAIAVHAYGHRIAWPAVALRPVLAGAAFAATLALALPRLSLLAASLAASLVYALAILALRVLDEREWELLRGLLRPGR